VTVRPTGFLHFQLKSKENLFYIGIPLLTTFCDICSANIAETTARPLLISKVRKRTLKINFNLQFNSTLHSTLQIYSDHQVEASVQVQVQPPSLWGGSPVNIKKDK
jgi:hypothetical protein